ncbi:hypothetical protein NPM06_20165 [Bacillus cereus]|uniref:hypothetical protein n=1 Tax=Bacillus cereus TaxID=1396 RepID=UPI00211173AE|nr:hypothetical protein [Bacillus cereus]
MAVLNRSKVYILMVVVAVNSVLGFVSGTTQLGFNVITIIPFLALLACDVFDDELIGNMVKEKAGVLKKTKAFFILNVLCLLSFCVGYFIYWML